MFDKTERQFFGGQDVQGVIQLLQQVLYSNGVVLSQTGPTTWAGRGTIPSYSIVPRVSVSVSPTPQGFCLDMRTTADNEGSGIVVFVVLWFVFFPAAIIVAFLAYQDFQQRQQALMQAMWAPLSPRFVAPNFAPAFGQPGPGQPPPAY